MKTLSCLHLICPATGVRSRSWYETPQHPPVFTPCLNAQALVILQLNLIVQHFNLLETKMFCKVRRVRLAKVRIRPVECNSIYFNEISLIFQIYKLEPLQRGAGVHSCRHVWTDGYASEHMCKYVSLVRPQKVHSAWISVNLDILLSQGYPLLISIKWKAMSFTSWIPIHNFVFTKYFGLLSSIPLSWKQYFTQKTALDSHPYEQYLKTG